MNTFVVPKCIETSILVLVYVSGRREPSTQPALLIFFCFLEKILQYIFTSVHHPNYCKKWKDNWYVCKDELYLQHSFFWIYLQNLVGTCSD